MSAVIVKILQCPRLARCTVYGPNCNQIKTRTDHRHHHRLELFSFFSPSRRLIITNFKEEMNNNTTNKRSRIAVGKSRGG